MSASMSDWVAGARPRTLWSAVTPVLVGTAAAASIDLADWGLAALALGVALALQVGVNYANDYSDGVRGTDADRVGPARLVASGKARPSAVKAAAFASFGVAALLGLGIASATGRWWLIAVGAVCIAAAWTYTGSARPYGYAGLGEVAVFVFYGPVAVLGTMFIQASTVTWWAAVASAGVALFAVAMLLVNNIRDLDSDALAGKRTLAVRLGQFGSRRLYSASLTLPLAAAVLITPARPWALLTLLLLLPTLLASLAMRAGVRGRPMAAMFSATAGLGTAYGVLLAAGIALG